MKLFLTSKFVNVAEKLSELMNDKPRVVGFIATASEVEEDNSYVELDKNKFKELGFKIKDIDLYSKYHEELEKELSDCSVIFVEGGNCFYLLQEARKSGFDKVIEKLKNTDILYVGCSAGSVLAGSDIGLLSSLDEPSLAPELKDYKGLCLVDAVILPHYGKTKYEEQYKKIMQEIKNKNIKFKTLTDDEYIAIEIN